MSEIPEPVPTQTTFSKLLPWIVLLLSAMGLFYFVQKGCGTGPTEPPPPQQQVDTVAIDHTKVDTTLVDTSIIDTTR
jgi:hypothetical protein